MDRAVFEKRKLEHLHLAQDAQFQVGFDFNSIHVFHDALPELNFEEISLETFSFGKLRKTPFFIASMTAGHLQASRINRLLAACAQMRGWALGLGSMRRDLELESVEDWSSFRRDFPDLELFANIGISQVIKYSTQDVLRMLHLSGSRGFDGIMVHCNILQELIQHEGTPQFKGGIEKLKELKKFLKIPLILKETGCGFSMRSLLKLGSIHLDAIDVSGLGGTHWGRIEGARSGANSSQAITAEVFKNWGENTIESVSNAVVIPGSHETWGSGGVRSGLDALKLICIGARRIGFAKPALDAAVMGEASLLNWMEQMELQLKTGLMVSGFESPEKLLQEENREGKIWIKNPK